jgi:hypothetical protein
MPHGEGKHPVSRRGFLRSTGVGVATGPLLSNESTQQRASDEIHFAPASTPSRTVVSIQPKADAAVKAAISIPATYSSPISRVAIALDVMADGQYLGQIAEAVVDVRSPNT